LPHPPAIEKNVQKIQVIIFQIFVNVEYCYIMYASISHARGSLLG
jgi:hypothetical protein